MKNFILFLLILVVKMLVYRGNDMLQAEHIVLVMAVAWTQAEFKSNYWLVGKRFKAKTRYFTSTCSTSESDFL